MAHRKSFSGRDLGIDLGTANTVVYVRGEGIVLNEPSVVAVNAVGGEVISVGAEAKSTMGRTPSHVVALRPLRDGVIADFEMAERILAHFMRKVTAGRRFTKPRVVICVPSGITSVERRAVIEAATTAGARQVYLIDEPMAAAVGAGLPVSEPVCSMVVDIGGGTTEVAAISLGGIITARSVRSAGDAIDAAITTYVRREHALLIGEGTAEAVKLALGTAAPAGYWPDGLGLLDEEFDSPERKNAGQGADTPDVGDREPDPVASAGLVTVAGSGEGAGRRCRIRGRDPVSGLPKTLELDAAQVRNAIDEPLDAIIEAVRQTLDACPPEAVSDIMERGIVLTGGGALLPGLDVRLSGAFDIPVMVADSPLDCVALGTGRCVENYEALRTVLDARPDKYLAYRL